MEEKKKLCVYNARKSFTNPEDAIEKYKSVAPEIAMGKKYTPWDAKKLIMLSLSVRNNMGNADSQSQP